MNLQEKSIIEVKTWHKSTPNNSTGAGYGIRFSPSYFENLKNWQVIILGDSGIILKRGRKVLNQPCTEIRSKLIGKYLIQNNLINWEQGKPFKLNLEYLGDNKFKLYI